MPIINFTHILLYSLPFLSDASTPAPRHAAYILTTKYAALAGLPSSPPSDPLCLPQLLEKAIDNLPYPPLQPVMHTDAILFSIYHSLHNLLISCRTSLLQSGKYLPNCVSVAPALSSLRVHHTLPSPDREGHSLHLASDQVR